MQDRTDTDVDDQPPHSPADALAIIEREQARQVPPYWIFYLIWGAAWAVIGLAWFANGTGVVTALTAGVLTGLAIAGGRSAAAWSAHGWDAASPGRASSTAPSTAGCGRWR